MLKWNQINSDILEAHKTKTFKYSDGQAEYEAIAKKILGLGVNCEIADFKFEFSVYGHLTEGRFAAQFEYEAGIVNEVLLSGAAEEAGQALRNEAYHGELLNLFDQEDEKAPDIAMFKEFVCREAVPFQTMPGKDSHFWISEWSDVNSWACYWVAGNKFNCLGKMSR